jgi:hypothetical protein
MNLLSHDSKMKLFSDTTNHQTPKWSHHMEDLVRRTTKNLNTGVYMMPSTDLYGNNLSVRSTSKGVLLDEMSYYPGQKSFYNQRPATTLNGGNMSHIPRGSNTTGFINPTHGISTSTLHPKSNYTLNQHKLGHEPAVIEETEDLREDLEAHFIYANKIAGRSHT